MYNLTDILNLVSKKTGCYDATGSSDIESDLGCYSDDFHELISEYSKTFTVDMTSYLWYFHTGEEGNNFGGYFFKAPYERVKRIPVTPDMLLEFANKGKWDLKYPPHKIPKKRYDILINTVLVLLAIAFAIYYWFIK
ncbi:MAG: DUF1493 family protein [Chitinophagaceae bacterium]|nr:DUF1493 family protein [Chitinophagaceae bacterium]